MSGPSTRANDPGIRLYQLADEPRWVICPRCSGPARHLREHVACKSCGYSEGPPAVPSRRRLKKARIAKASPRCNSRSCGAPIPTYGKAVAGSGDEVMAEVDCPTCGHVGRYPAWPVSPNDGFRAARNFWRKFYRRDHPLYLARQVNGHWLVAYNLRHIDMLEEWLGAKHRERGPVAGLTMMARLPRWMKAASARPDVIKALADMREQAVREGLS